MSGTPYKEQSERHQFRPEEVEEFDADIQTRFHKQDVVRDKLIEEAKLISHLVPSQSLEQIYSFLETNVDNQNRVQIVTKRLTEMESQPSTSYQKCPMALKRTLEKYDHTDEESPYSPKHGKVIIHSTDQETAMDFQPINTNKLKTANEEKVEGSEEYGTATESMECEDDISIVDSVTDNNHHLYVDEESRISTRQTTNVGNTATHFITPTENTLRRCLSLLSIISHKILNTVQNSIGNLATSSTDDPQPGSSSAPESDDDEIERQYKTLREILPNADPSFLKETCIRIDKNEDQMIDFIIDALEKSNYPTLEQYRKRQKVLSLQQKYIEDFKVEEFVEIFPDPLKYFLEENKNKVEIYKYTMAYLKSRYKKIRQVDLHKKLRKSKYSLTETCLKLDKFKGPFLKKEREEFDWKLDMPLEVCTAILQEIALMKNKEKILSYLQENEEKRKAAFLEAKANGKLLECECCFDNEVMAEDMATCIEGHFFCKDCIRKGAEVKIGDGETKFPCFSDCGAEFHLKTLQAVLNPLIFSKMLQRKQIEEVKAAGIEGLETCPYCDFASIPPTEDKVFRCLNPDCMIETCRKCREPSHIPLRCEELEANEVRIRTTIENRMTEALVRRCWKCGKGFVKESGCNVIGCTCGALMCYFCRKPMAKYSDIFEHNCPHISTDRTLHVIPVRKEEKKAKEELKNSTVNFKHDPKSDFPAPVQQKHKTWWSTWPF